MNELYDLLTNISKVSLFFLALSLLMFYYVDKNKQAKSSSFITVVLIVGLYTIMLSYQALLDWYMGPDPKYNPVVNFVWYMGFASFYLAGMAVLYKVHKKENIRIGSLGQYASFSFFVAGSLQLFQYIEILVFKTDKHLDKLYTYGIPAINITTVAICFGFALIALYYTYFHKNGVEGLKRWTI